MTALVHKIRNSFSDLWLEVELAMAKLFKRKHSADSASDQRSNDQPKIEYNIPKPKDEEKKVAESLAPATSKLENEAKVASKTATETVAKKEDKKSEKLPFGLRMLRLSSKQRLTFFDQMSTLIGSGVMLIDSLNLIKAQSKSKNIKRLYTEIIHSINSGESFADAMRIFPHIFPEMQAALIEAGEKSGNMDKVLAQLSSEMQDQQDFFKKVTGAMFYPMILLFLATALVIGMMIFVIPRLATMYEQANVSLPAITQLVINISDFIRVKWLFLLVSVVGGFTILWLLFSKTRFGKIAFENMVGVFPLFGKISKEKSLMIIASNMGMLLQSGVLISDALEITERTLGSLHYQRGLKQVRHDIIMGKSVSEAMGLVDIENKHFKESKLFPLQFSQLMNIGEKTGSIGSMFGKLRDNYHRSIDYKLKNISTVIEPLMIMVVAALVGVILLAVMMPFFYIGTTIG